MRKLCCVALPFSMGVITAIWLLPVAFWLPSGLFCAVGALPGLLLRGDRRLRWLLVALGLGTGLLWSWGYHMVVVAPTAELDGQTVQLTAAVLDWPYATQSGCAMAVKLDTPAGRVKAILYADEASITLKPGATLTMLARLNVATQRRGKESDYYRSRSIQMLAYAASTPVVTREAGLSPRYWPVVVARALKESVVRCFPADTSTLVTALITGDKSSLPAGLYSDIRRVGLAHVVAVSGMHVSFLAGLVAVLLGNRRRLSAGLCMALLFFFSAVAGGTPSVLRAVLMQGILLLAPLLGREEDKATTLSAVLLMLLVSNPYGVASVSLQLSFSAVAGIHLFSGSLYQRWLALLPTGDLCVPLRVLRGAAQICAGTIATTLGALAFTTPITAYYFGTLSLVAPLGNLLTLWAVSTAFLGGLLTAVAGLILPVVGGVLGWLFSIPIRWILGVVGVLAKLPFAAVALDSIYLHLWLVLAYLLLSLYLLWHGAQKQLLVPVSLCIISLCVALVLTAAGRMAGALSLTVLDVGQGLSVALYSGGRSALVDCGGSGSESAGDVAADYFQSMGLTSIDLLVLTHCHADHANGVSRLLERLNVGTILMPPATQDDVLTAEILALAAARGIPVEMLDRNAQITFGASTLRVFGPMGDGGANEEGLSLLCTSGSFDALITGDMNDAVEARLVKYGDLPDIEVLVVGHHGSRYASSEALMLATTPEYAIISVGYNSYGHPAGAALARLATAGCDIYRTDLMGNVTITAAFTDHPLWLPKQMIDALED